MATSNTNFAVSSDSVFPQLPSNVQNGIRTNISTFTDIVNQYRSSNTAATGDLPLAPVANLVNAAYGSSSPFLNGNAIGDSSGNNTVAGSGSVSSGSSPVTGSSSVIPLRSPSEVLKLVQADISTFYNLANQNSGTGSQLPQSSSDVLQLFASDIATFSSAIDQLQSGNNAIASTSTPIV
ncbi:hypothetical protein SD81_022410 [Tolypothrix campylonemoides VB511288]|nr:hypothetical protein SD81_022410 [Tolypothrix campylonemoides VB511288]